MLTLKDLEVLAIDCQATHSNPDKGLILEIGWVRTRASEVSDCEKILKKAESYLLKTARGSEVPKTVLRITGMTQEELKHAQRPKDIWQRILRAAEDTAIKNGPNETLRAVQRKTIQDLEPGHRSSCPAVIHFCRYEEPFLRQLCKKYSPEKEFPFSIICTHEIMKRLMPGLPRKSLRAVAGYFGQSLPDSRRSLHHVAATALIWSHLVARLEGSIDIQTYEELQGWLRKPITALSNQKNAHKYPLAEVYRKDLPHLPGVYRMYRSGGDLLYIGKAKSLRQRIGSYFHKGSRHPEHILEMLSQAQSLDTAVTRTAFEAALVESDEIKRHSPPYNRALRTNEREMRFFSQDLKIPGPRPDSFHSIGPLPTSFNLDPLILLGEVLNGDTRKVSRKVIAGILDIPPEYLPDRACFISGVKAFKREFQKTLQPTYDLTTWMSLGAQFWKEKLEEQVAEEAKKREAAETASTGKGRHESIDTIRALEEDISSKGKEEEILELKMQDYEDREIEDTWTAERIVRILKSIIRLSAFQIRRSRWFCRLCESSLVWTPSTGESEPKNLIMFKGGTPIIEESLSPSDKVPLSSGHANSLIDRQENFDLYVFDRMRVTTTEIRRLIQEGRSIELHLHPDVCLRNEQLKRMLQWV